MFSTVVLMTLAISKMAYAQAPATPSPTGAVAQAAAAAKVRAALLNEDFKDYIMIICGSLALALIIWKVWMELIKHVRTLACLNNENQQYFTIPSIHYANFKKYLLYAPIFRKRHNREFQLSAAINVGTLPTRFQLMFLSLYLGTNVAFCVVSINWDGDFTNTSKALRNRAGVLATINMVGYIAMAYDRGLFLEDY